MRIRARAVTHAVNATGRIQVITHCATNPKMESGYEPKFSSTLSTGQRVGRSGRSDRPERRVVRVARHDPSA